MRITIDLELQESELAHAPQVVQALQQVSDQVTTKVVTDKTALLQMLRDSLVKGNGDAAIAELTRRLLQPALYADCLEVLCKILFSAERVERGEPVIPYVLALNRIPEPQRSKARDDIVHRTLTFLATPRRLDSSRDILLPYAESIAGLVKVEALGVKNVVATLIQMIRGDSTRCAGITCLGKLVEIAHDMMLERCDAQLLEALRTSLGAAQQDDTFVYDLEYILEPFGWNQTPSQKFVHFSLFRSGVHHGNPIVALACSGAQTSREVVVTSSVDGTIATWDPQGKLIENCVLSRHYASALDLTKQGRAMLVGGVGRTPSTNPAVVFYAEELGRWVEKGAVEPEGGRVITSVKSIRSGSMSSLLFCCGVHGPGTNTLCYYDATRQSVLRDYHDHTDVLTCLFSPVDRENLVFSGSRDCTVMMYDLRMPTATGQQFSHHYSTVTAIDGFGDYVITAGLDKRVMVHDHRMLHPQNMVRDLDSAVISLSVSPQFICAAATLTGVQFINLTGSGLPTCKADPLPNGAVPRYNSVQWSTNGSILYCGGETATLDLLAAT